METVQLKQVLMSFMVVIACASFIATFAPLATASGLPIEGTVFLDLNGDGQRTAPGYIDDVGQQGVSVTAFDSDGNTSSAVTDANGFYSIETTSLLSGPYRVELTIPSGYTPAPAGGQTNTTVRQSIAAGSENINFSILEPNSYCSSNPRLIVSCFTSGDGRIASNASTATAPRASTRMFRFDDEYYPGHPQYNAPTNLTTYSQTGTVYGVGYSRSTGNVYQAAFLRRHAGMGPGGMGAIYEVDPNSGAVLRTLTVPNAGTEPANRGLSGNANSPSRDINAYSAVAKVGLGDLKVVGNGEALFTTNLNTRELVKVNNLSSATPTISSYSIPSSITCPGGQGDRRVFGLGTRVVDGESKVYVGVTCTGETSYQTSQMQGHVVEFDVATSTWGANLITIPLNYQKGCALINSVTGNLGCSWRAWSDNQANSPKYQVLNQWFTANPQPLISEIQFDQTGAMVIGIADRGGWQWGHENLPPLNQVNNIFGQPDPFNVSNQLHTAFAAGDQLRACPNLSGNFVFENNATCNAITTQGQNNNQGPGGGEYYWGDTIKRTDGPLTLGHDELGLGAFAFVPGRTTMAATITDPFFTLNGVSDYRSNSVGVAKLAHVSDPAANQTAGGWYGALELGIITAGTNNFAKAGGLGSLEVLCENAPIEIGNYVWFDENENGIQDPNENALEGVSVSLVDVDSEQVVATAKTNEFGEYLFASEGTPNVVAQGWDGPGPGDDNTNDAYGIVADPDGDLSNGNYGILPNKNYRVIFDTSTVVLNAELNSLGLTQASQLEPTDAINDLTVNGTLRDSNVIEDNGQFVVDLTTGEAGSNDHTFDAGFIAVPLQETTTTTEPTTTTTEATTTTTEPTTSTTEPTTTEPTTTTEVTTSTTPNTTVTSGPTTTVGGTVTSEPEDDTNVFGQIINRGTGALPFTGSETIQIVAVALIAIFVGSMLVFIRKKKQNAS